MDQNNNNKVIRQQANLWIDQIDRGLSASQVEQIIQWAQQSESHRNALFNVAMLWDDMTITDRLNDIFPQHQATKIHNNMAHYAVAMSVMLVLFVSISNLYNGFVNHWLNPTYLFSNVQHFKTAIGEQKSFKLSDGSTLQLNTNSVIDINFSESKRLLTLVQGEAQFSVAKDLDRPFTVQSGAQSFTALGTVFNIQKDSNSSAELTVTEGKVLITSNDFTLDKIPAHFTSLAENKLPATLVVMGEKAIVSALKKQPTIVKTTSKQLEQTLSWQQGMLIFDGETLADALTEVTRYTNTQFKFDNPNLAEVKVSGYFKANDVDGLLQSLQSNLGIKAHKTANSLIWLSKN